MNHRILFSLVTLGIIFTIGIILLNPVRTPDANAQKVIVYKSPNCGCCVQHSAYMKENGFDVTIKITDDMEEIKKTQGILSAMESCHTTIIGDYFVEGHVPMEAFKKLMQEKPDIDGIALPGMPSGSPGMPGPQLEPFEIYGLKDGQSSIYLTL